jgi:hypothetical protein
VGPAVELAARADLDVSPRPRDRARLVVDGPGGGSWSVWAESGAWGFAGADAAGALAQVRMPADVFWRPPRATTPGVARAASACTGDAALAAAHTGLVAIVR